MRQLNPGTGRHRRYDDSALEDALILNALADFGIPISIQREALILARNEKAILPRDVKARWRLTASQGMNLFLEIAMLPNGQLVPRCFETAMLPTGELVPHRYDVPHNVPLFLMAGV